MTKLNRHQILDLIGLVHRRKFEMCSNLIDNLDWIWSIEDYSYLEKSLELMLVETIEEERKDVVK